MTEEYTNGIEETDGANENSLEEEEGELSNLKHHIQTEEIYQDDDGDENGLMPQDGDDYGYGGSEDGQYEGEEGDEEEDDDELSAKLSELRGMMGNVYFPGQTQFSSIDHLLSKEEGLELEELLEQDDFLPDLRRAKSRLMQYLTRPNVLEQLVTYISHTIPEAEDPLEPDKRKRFVHLAYEAIQSDAIKEAVINSAELLSNFFSFLDVTSEMDPLRCAYFSRIVELLFERYPNELVAFLRKKGSIVAKFVWHINNQYIVESLFRLIDSQISHQWLHDEDLIPLLVYKMAECEDPEIQEKTAATFVEILDLFVPFPYSILTTQMFHNDIVAQQWESFTLRNSISNTTKESEPSSEKKSISLEQTKNGLAVGIGILSLSYEGNMADDTPVYMRTAIRNLPRLLEVVSTPVSNDTFNMTYGKLSPPFGFLRLKTVEFLNALLNTRYPAVVDAFFTSGVFPTLLNLFFYYRWNNTLHYYVDQMLSTVLAIDSGDRVISILLKPGYETEDEATGEKKTLPGCDLLNRIPDLFNTESARTVGYLGHLTHISNAFIKAASYNAAVSEILNGSAKWKAFAEGKLAAANLVNETPICGGAAAAGGAAGGGEMAAIMAASGHGGRRGSEG